MLGFIMLGDSGMVRGFFTGIFLVAKGAALTTAAGSPVGPLVLVSVDRLCEKVANLVSFGTITFGLSFRVGPSRGMAGTATEAWFKGIVCQSEVFSVWS